MGSKYAAGRPVGSLRWESPVSSYLCGLCDLCGKKSSVVMLNRAILAALLSVACCAGARSQTPGPRDGGPPVPGTRRPKKKIPKFRSEHEEREFWSKADSTDYVDWDDANRLVLPRLKPSQKTISLRLPAMMLAELKRLANKRDVPYQSLLKILLAERLDEVLRASRSDQASA